MQRKNNKTKENLKNLKTKHQISKTRPVGRNNRDKMKHWRK